MPGDLRVQQLLDEMLDSDLTPEDVCENDPSLLQEVRLRWERMRRVNYELDELFPSVDPINREEHKSRNEKIELPQLDGYDVQALLGRGGMGVVFKAYQKKLGRFVALKTLLAGAYAGPHELMRFRREVEAIATLRHPNIVQIYDLGGLDGSPYFTMEFVEGGSLSEKLSPSPSDHRRVAELVAILAVTVQFAHKSGIIHRDLKPGNILLTPDGTPKISDFGLARFIDAETELTMGGARLGTPGYMAPEQAAGKINEIGPGVDIYALGAVMYRMLTGEPPPQGRTTAETDRQGTGEESRSPSRINATVPRDLETICLKCLKNNPARRYASAQDLADDLHRFLDGKPIHARPVSAFERFVKLARRHPAISTLTATMVILTASTVGIGSWLHHQENLRHSEMTQREDRAREVIESAVVRAYQSAGNERWEEARLILASATTHLADAHSDELSLRITQTSTDVQFSQELDRIRQTAANAIVENNDTLSALASLAKEYAAAFAQARFDINDEQKTSMQIRASPVRNQAVIALEQWAFAAFLLERESLHKQLLRIAQLAEPDSAWVGRFRDAGSWRNAQKLLELTEEAEKATKSTNPPVAHQLAILGILLRLQDEALDETRLLIEALRQPPGEFWLNWEMARALVNKHKYAEAANYFRILVALRPENAWAHVFLGNTLIVAGRVDEGLVFVRQGVNLAPQDRTVHYNLVMSLYRAGRAEEAIEECQSALVANPTDDWTAYALGMVYLFQGHHAEAAAMFQKTVELDPQRVDGYCNLGMMLGSLRRFEESAAALHKAIELDPMCNFAHLGLGLYNLNQRRPEQAIAELQIVIEKLKPRKRPAEMLSDDSVNSTYITARQGLIAALLSMGRFDEVIAESKHLLEFPKVELAQRRATLRFLEIGRQLAPWSAKLPEIVAGTIKPTDSLSQRACAEWFLLHRQCPVAAIRWYEAAFQQQPSLANDVDAENRFHAACAAAMAGCGMGEDAAMLNNDEKTNFRKKALEWLRDDLEVWGKRNRVGDIFTQSYAAQKLSEWPRNHRLDMVRDEASLSRLPAEERAKWQKLWSEIEILSANDPVVRIKQAHQQVARKQWLKAAESYGRIVKESPKVEDNLWFEYAAVQVLSGDCNGYRETCKLLLERANKASRIRPYLVARVCTLAPDSVENPLLPSQISADELQRSAKEFWSLTEQGALHYRENRFEKAKSFFEASLRVEKKRGSAILNWLWLAMTYHKLNNMSEARKWLEKACHWLDLQGNTLPSNIEETGLHPHNWLEAHILRREAEMLISPSSGERRCAGRRQ